MNSPADRRAIEEATARLLEGVNSSNVIQVLSVWADDGVLMPPNHPAMHGKAAIEASELLYGGLQDPGHRGSEYHLSAADALRARPAPVRVKPFV